MGLRSERRSKRAVPWCRGVALGAWCWGRGVGGVVLGRHLLEGRKGHTPRGEANHRGGHGDARGGNGACHLKDVGRLELGQRRALDRHERVDRHRLRVLLHGAQLVQEADAVRLGLAETEDAAAADGDARGADVLDGLEAVVVRPRRYHRRVVLAGRVEVVVVRRQSGLLELLGLLLVDHAEGAAHLETERVDLAHHRQNLSERALLVPKLAPRRPHAETSGARLLGATGRGDNVVHGHHGRRLHRGLVAAGLRAVLAVLVAPARLDREQRALLHLQRVKVLSVDAGRAEDELGEREVVNRGELLARPVGAHDRCRRARSPADDATHGAQHPGPHKPTPPMGDPGEEVVPPLDCCNRRNLLKMYVCM